MRLPILLVTFISAALSLPTHHLPHINHRSRTSHSTTAHVAPLIKTNGKTIADRWIVVLKEGVEEVDMVVHHMWLAERMAWANVFSGEGQEDFMERTFDVGGVFKGYSGRFSPTTLSLLRTNPLIAHIEQDQIMSVDYIQDASLIAQKDAPWGLARISHKALPKTPETQSEYVYREGAGEGVVVYVIDTGVFVGHKDFEGRASWGITVPAGDQDVDGNGHGTHCAGTIAGKRFGVAKSAKIVAVKVLRSNGSGTLSDVIKGVEWVVDRHIADVANASKRDAKAIVKSVANMSLGGGSSPALDRAVDVAVQSGIHFAVAAGNSGDDACDYSPAASALAVTVGATTSTDTMAYFSNHGRCTDVFGPGYNVLSTWIGSPNATATLSGTSMASPHTAGVLAALSSFAEFSAYAPEDLKKHLVESAHRDVIKGIPTWAGGPEQNRLLFLEENVFASDDEEEDETIVDSQAENQIRF
ncbi:peptidase S8/S53 domain-containing protein [Chytridium lagenaria]|nr:peptidase S8/S53 domain-containing protein [Chytridium lagenaria]